MTKTASQIDAFKNFLATLTEGQASAVLDVLAAHVENTELTMEENEEPPHGHDLIVALAATKAAKVDPSEGLARALTDAAVAVAHCTAEVVDMAESDGKGGFTIDADDMHQLRALLGAWSRAGEALMQHIRTTKAA